MKIYKLFGHVIYWLTRPIQIPFLARGLRAYVAIMVGDELLIVRNWLSDGRWSLPGGGIKRGESKLLAAKRELMEEIALHINPDDLTVLGQGSKKLIIGSRKYVILRLEVAIKPQVLINPLEITGYRWLKISEVTKLRASQDLLDAARLLG